MTDPLSPRRTFDPMIPRVRCGRPIPDTEDLGLTGFLLPLVEAILSDDETPPACPHCGHARTRVIHRARVMADGMPGFRCSACRRYFKRGTGTPLAGLARKDLLAGFIGLLSQQKPYAQAADELGADIQLVRRWTMRFRAWLLELDPSGQWEARVRLGIAPPLDALGCPACGEVGTLVHHGFGRRRRADDHDRRQLRCTGCQAFVLIPEDADAVRSYPARLYGRGKRRAAEARPRRKRIGPLEGEMVARANTGESYREIARALGVSEATVSAVVRHHRAAARGEAVAPRRPPGRQAQHVPDAVLADVHARRRAGETYAAWPRRMGSATRWSSKY
ncbi:DUF746 domain-containing protein [Sphingomonas cavernae]|uniref:DUF746 domain-containing protein n=1 Tax=Sphingomonas cavernae TaxID=2320861 RepID=A0A418W7Z3_9SPHN|nr:DUF746 domain-containing protein [Sphingomonas cavernae]RJF86118.1 DUF746 domain-containing protein [Sphingomonas cavernae]